MGDARRLAPYVGGMNFQTTRIPPTFAASLRIMLWGFTFAERASQTFATAKSAIVITFIIVKTPDRTADVETLPRDKFDKIGDLSVKIEMKFENVMRWKLMNVMVAFMELYERKKLKMLSKKWGFFSCGSALVCFRRTVRPCTRLISESMDVIVALFLRVCERKKLKMLAKKWSDFSCDSHVCQRTKGPVRKKLKIDASSNFSVFYLPWQF